MSYKQSRLKKQSGTTMGQLQKKKARKFKVGDKVVMVSNTPNEGGGYVGGQHLIGCVGVVRKFSSPWSASVEEPESCEVEFMFTDLQLQKIKKRAKRLWAKLESNLEQRRCFVFREDLLSLYKPVVVIPKEEYDKHLLALTTWWKEKKGYE